MGKLGADMTGENGQKAAATVMLNLLGTLKAELGELSRVSRFVKLLVFVNSTGRLRRASSCCKWGD
jgi:hypothetical protein